MINTEIAGWKSIEANGVKYCIIYIVQLPANEKKRLLCIQIEHDTLMVTIDCQKNSNNAGLATFNANAFSKVRSYTAC